MGQLKCDRGRCLLLVAATFLFAGSGRAESERPSTDRQVLVDAPESKRELEPQDYPESRRGTVRRADQARRVLEQQDEPEDALLLVPRALLFLPNLALRTLFLPIRYAAVLVDEYHLIAHTEDLLYNDARTAGVLPVLGFQTEFGITAGAKAFHDDVFDNDEELSATAEYGGLYLQSYKLSFEGERIRRSLLWLESDVRYESKPNLSFWGYGNQSLADQEPTTAAAPRDTAVETHFSEQHVMASLLTGATIVEPGQKAQLGAMAIYHHREFGPKKRASGEPSIDQVYDTDQLTGFDTGVDVVEVGPVFAYDSRRNQVLTTSGTFFDSFAAYAVPANARSGYWHYGITAAGFFSIFRDSRVLSLRAVLEAVHGDAGDIPFTELVRLGGPERLRGYGLDRFRDEVALLGSIEYRYPVHALVAGELFVDAGHVGPSYGETFLGFADNPLRVGGGAGLVFHDQEKLLFKAQVAFGEEVMFFFSSDPLEALSERHKRL